VKDARPTRDFQFTLKMALDERIDCIQGSSFPPARRAVIDVRTCETTFLFIQPVTEQRFQILFNPLTIHSHVLFLPFLPA
jgi:hypothetical protein